MANTRNAVAHAWAHQTGRQHNGKSIFYQGDTIYSYRQSYPIGRLATIGGRFTPVVLLRSDSCSVTTSGHISFARRAVSHLPVFTVPDVTAATLEAHGANWEWFITKARDSLGKAKRARTWADSHLRDAREALERAAAYSDAFQLGKPVVTLESLEPALAEIAERAAVAAAQQAEARTMREEARRREQRQYERDRHVTLSAWLKGSENVQAPHTRRPWVRVKGDVVQTTWGAEVPLRPALMAARAAKLQRTHAFMGDGLLGRHIGPFVLNEIGPRGNLVIGCHNIPWQAVKVAADLAGIAL